MPTSPTRVRSVPSDALGFRVPCLCRGRAHVAYVPLLQTTRFYFRRIPEARFHRDLAAAWPSVPLMTFPLRAVCALPSTLDAENTGGTCIIFPVNRAVRFAFHG